MFERGKRASIAGASLTREAWRETLQKIGHGPGHAAFAKTTLAGRCSDIIQPVRQDGTALGNRKGGRAALGVAEAGLSRKILQQAEGEREECRALSQRMCQGGLYNLERALSSHF